MGIDLEKLRRELREITKQVTSALHRRLDLDRLWIARGGR